MDLSPVLRPSSIAVVGASPRTFVGQVAIENSRLHGFAGAVYPVGRHDRVAGLACYPGLAALPQVPDVVAVQVRADAVLAVVEEGLHLGVRGFVIPGAGYTDSGDVAVSVRTGLDRLRQEHDFTVVGPNCMGFVDLVTGAAPYVGTAPCHLRRGPVAVIAQSGAIVEAVVNAGGRVAVSTVVSSGSEAVTDFADYVDFFRQDPETEAVLGFVEALGDPHRSADAVRRLVAAGKPVAVCVVGHSSTAKDGIAAHSGKLASGAKVLAAALRQAGAVVADDLDELLTMGEVFSTGRLPAGGRTHVVTNSGGEASLLADIAEEVGLQLPVLSRGVHTALGEGWPRFHPRNPLDPWGADDYEKIYPEVLRHAVSEPGDLVVVAVDQQRTSGGHEHTLGLDLARYLALATEDSHKVPVLLSPTSQDPSPELASYCQGAGIALLRGARPALASLAKLARREQVAPVPAAVPPPAEAVLSPSQPALDEDGVLQLLSTLGVSTPARRRASTIEEVEVAAGSMGGTVVLKGVAADLLHKTELGLVRTGIVSPAQARSAAQDMAGRARAHGLDIDYLVVEQIDGALEVMVGYKRDAAFGPTVMVGSGGVWAEFFDDAEIHVGPLDRAGAARLLARSRPGQMMARARGGALCAEGVVTALCAVSDLGRANPDIVGIDINPLIVSRARAIAVDAVVERRPIERNRT